MRIENFAGFDDGPGAFLDSAAIMENCDLVISCDTALAHLAGALGVPNWIALKYVPEWRWFLGRSDTPWYPNTRLFRQAAPGDWDSVFRAMEKELTSRKS
jgi:ADP-heptose:LPS heptosyltransferase